MFVFTTPGDGAIRDRLAQLSGAPYSYAEVGALENPVFPPGYRADRHRAPLGRGAACYERAKAALQRWEMFNVAWVRLHPQAPPIAVDTAFGISARYLGVWNLNFCRIAYTVEDKGEVERSGFGLGTLPGHILSGEERFCVEWHRADDSVWYHVCAFSRPDRLLSRLGYPIVRQLQTRFARESHAAMARATAV
ncbi:MAG: DUF1990 domain-containing protein [Betaproteobacteria bacterium]|nr:DUF1990 domain-containing protein [Betaproteobacteria bacterium]